MENFGTDNFDKHAKLSPIYLMPQKGPLLRSFNSSHPKDEPNKRRMGSRE